MTPEELRQAILDRTAQIDRLREELLDLRSQMEAQPEGMTDAELRGAITRLAQERSASTDQVAGARLGEAIGRVEAVLRTRERDAELARDRRLSRTLTRVGIQSHLQALARLRSTATDAEAEHVAQRIAIYEQALAQS